MDAITNTAPVEASPVVVAALPARALHRALSIVCSVVPSTRPQPAEPKKVCRSGAKTIPVLGCVLLRATPETGLVLTSTNLDQRLTTRVPDVTPQASLTTLLDHPHRLMAWLSALPREVTVDIWPCGDSVRFGTANEELILPIFGNPADFPDAPDSLPEGAATFCVDPGYVGDVLDRVSAAMSTEETRYHLNGILLQAVEGRLVATATDGHRLISIARGVPQDPAGAFAESDLARGAIVPRDAVHLWRRLLPYATTIRLADGRLLSVTDGETTLLTKLIDGTYPDYVAVVRPVLTGTRWTASMPRGPLFDHLRRWARALGRDRNAKLRIERGVVGGRMHFEVKFAGDRSADIRLCGYLPAAISGKDDDILPFFLNADYLRCAIGLVRGAAVELRIIDPGSPIQVCDPGDPNLTVIMMPMWG